MPRTCLGCGQVGHGLESCKSKAAVQIRRLRSILGNKVGARNNPGRKHRKSGYTRKACTKKKWGRLTVKNAKKKEHSDMVWISSETCRSRMKITCWDRRDCFNMASCIDWLDAWRADVQCRKTKTEAAAREWDYPHPNPTHVMCHRHVCIYIYIHCISWSVQLSLV